jgi:hypothetical protein
MRMGVSNTDETGGRVRRILGPIAIWGLLVAVGALASAHFAARPAKVNPAPSHWPNESSLSLHPSRPTLLVFLHPQCPCSRATLAELGVILARCADKVAVQLVFVYPTGLAEDWTQSDLWQMASQLTSASLHIDRGGAEAKRFGAATSGEAFLYAASGARMFRGGITWARGHEGENAGRNAVESLILGRGDSSPESPVFGCPLLDD